MTVAAGDLGDINRPPTPRTLDADPKLYFTVYAMISSTPAAPQGDPVEVDGYPGAQKRSATSLPACTIIVRLTDDEKLGMFVVNKRFPDHDACALAKTALSHAINTRLRS